MAGKLCPECNEFKDVEKFGVDRHRPSGLATYCKICAAARSRLQYRRRKQRNDELSANEIYARARKEYGG